MSELSSPKVVLASGSAIRADLMRAAGVDFAVQPARIDEPAIIASLAAEQAHARDIADTLAEYKARQISVKAPDALVIGADQVLVCEGQIYQKPADLLQTRAQLSDLRGKGHQLLSAVVVYEGGKPVWRTLGRAQLTMRSFSDEFLETYLANEGTDVLETVGCYKLEGAGVTLFSRVDGDYFTVLGLPLLELLEFLRTRKAIPA